MFYSVQDRGPKFRNQRDEFFKGFDVAGLEKMLKDVQDGILESPMVSKVQGSKFPFADICTDSEGTLHIEIAAAGFAKEDFDISMEDGMLVVKGTVSEETIKDDENMKYFQKEIAKRNFIRKFALDSKYAESDLVSATSNNGILTISIWPIEEEKPKARKFLVD